MDAVARLLGNIGKRIRVVRPFEASSAETSIRSLTANILCRDHNSELGRTAVPLRFASSVTSKPVTIRYICLAPASFARP